MSLIFTDQLDKPSEITPIPNQFLRPVFGALYGFDTPQTPSGFNIDLRDTHANITARTGDADGTIAFGTDTYDLYVFYNSTWHFYYND
jgi:hypothetical protein